MDITFFSLSLGSLGISSAYTNHPTIQQVLNNPFSLQSIVTQLYHEQRELISKRTVYREWNQSKEWSPSAAGRLDKCEVYRSTERCWMTWELWDLQGGNWLICFKLIIFSLSQLGPDLNHLIIGVIMNSMGAMISRELHIKRYPVALVTP